MINIINSTVCYIQKLRVNPKSFDHKEKFIFLFFNFISIWDDGCPLNLWYHDACKLNHYDVYFKLT